MIRSVLTSCLLGTSLLFCGCSGGEDGPELLTVEGTASYAGEPIKEGQIVLKPASGEGHHYGAPIVDGEFEVETTAGEKLVIITAMRDVPGKFSEANPGEKVPVREQYIPPKYNKETTLKETVDPSGDDWKLELTGEGD